MTPNASLDHLVIAADSLDQGVAWCEATLGVTPAAGGEHPLMGTHNRLLRLEGTRYPGAYLEIIAINPAAADPGRRRWFDLDDGALREAVRSEPRLVHFVAATGAAAASVRALSALGIDRGPLLQAQRPSPDGLLRWQISVRDDGQRLFYGALPTLIQWDSPHPAGKLPPSGLELEALHASHPRPADLQAACAAIGLQDVAVNAGAPNLVAVFHTPRGRVLLESKGL
ncbi:VOC family protein [uncultured Ramlibacter sp.]|uniref:VOC family protein n=1 Tax=uncultured Ramlibacter sp. TaxID=260755 RepID=UPI00262E596F|nr:VOC family protein [uncultured Ramlibacter sp.]